MSGVIQPIIKNKFTNGLKLVGDVVDLGVGRTTICENVDLSVLEGLRPIKGFKAQREFNQGTAWKRSEEFRTPEKQFYIKVSYPHIYLVNKDNLYPQRIWSKWIYTGGNPGIVQVNEREVFIYDGQNGEIFVKYEKGKITVKELRNYETSPSVFEDRWNKNFTAANNDAKNMGQGETQVTNPTTAANDFGRIKFAALINGKLVVVDDKNPTRLYFSTALDFSDFRSNGVNDWDVAFFYNLKSRDPIVAVKQLTSEVAVIYTTGGMWSLTGRFPQGSLYDTNDQVRFKKIKDSVGLVSERMIITLDDTDHIYMGVDGGIYRTVQSDTFEKARPFGLSYDIFPLFETLSLETLERGFMIHDEQRKQILIALPSSNSKRFPDRILLASYLPRKDMPTYHLAFGQMVDFGEIQLRDFVFDSKSRDILFLGRRKIYKAFTGNTFDGKGIRLRVDIPFETFHDTNTWKKIYLRLFARSGPGAKLFIEQENDRDAGYVYEIIQKANVLTWGDATKKWDDTVYGTSLGLPIRNPLVIPENNEGHWFRFLISHDSLDVDTDDTDNFSGDASTFDLSRLEINYSFNKSNLP